MLEWCRAGGRFIIINLQPGFNSVTNHPTETDCIRAAETDTNCLVLTLFTVWPGVSHDRQVEATRYIQSAAIVLFIAFTSSQQSPECKAAHVAKLYFLPIYILGNKVRYVMDLKY